MNGEMHYVPLRERRDYVPYFEQRDKERREANLSLGWMFIVIIVALSFFIHTFVEPVVTPEHAQAEQTGPMTNKEACQDLKEGGFVQGGHMKDIVTLCAKEGIQL